MLAHGDPTKGVEPLPFPAPEPRALAEAQVRTVKNVLDRIEGFHRLTGRAHREGDARRRSTGTPGRCGTARSCT